MVQWNDNTGDAGGIPHGGSSHGHAMGRETWWSFRGALQRLIILSEEKEMVLHRTVRSFREGAVACKLHVLLDRLLA